VEQIYAFPNDSADWYELDGARWNWLELVHIQSNYSRETKLKSRKRRQGEGEGGPSLPLTQGD
jgi:hypothetical protein